MAVNIDPVQGLVDYTKFVKPYHTKILEVLVEYIHTDCIDVTLVENFYLSFGMPDVDLLSLWGWTEAQAKKFFNCDFEKYQISGVNPVGGYWEVQGDISSKVQVGDILLYQKDQTSFTEYTVSSVTLINTSVALNLLGTGSPQPGCGNTQDTYSLDPNTVCPVSDSYSITRISVVEALSPTTEAKGVLHPYKSSFVDSNGNTVNTACWTFDPRGIYTRNVGIVLPSNVYVEENINCNGYGYIFQQAVSGSPPDFDNGLDTSNTIISVNTTLRYFEIQNDVGVPSVISSWADGFTYGAKFTVTGSTGNDSDNYTVYFSHVVNGSPDLLRIYTLESVSSGIADGTLQLRPWGYDEPDVCINDGQSLSAATSITEEMTITINDNLTNFVQGWDTSFWDMDGYDGGPYTYLVAFT